MINKLISTIIKSRILTSETQRGGIEANIVVKEF